MSADTFPNSVVIIGGSLAGAACARELVRRGIDAVALERDTFPRPKVCGGFLSPGAVECLDELGLLDDVRAAGAVEVDHARIRVDGDTVEIPFRQTGLGISRSALDQIVADAAPVKTGVNVVDVKTIKANVIIDAAGKLSRWSKAVSSDEFGIQYAEPGTRGSALDFWFFEDGYGGGVTVEGGQSNFCFLIKKVALPRYLGQPGRLVTGPIAYQRSQTEYISIGDAAGMIDPFCGEGMHHALDSGIVAARVVARGLRDGVDYATMKQTYEMEMSRRWSTKRMLTSAMRETLRYPSIVRHGLRWKAGWFLDKLWATIPTS